MGGIRKRIADWWFRRQQKKRTDDAVKGKKPFGRLPSKDTKPTGEVSVKSEGKAVIRARVIRADGRIEDLGVVAGNPNIKPL